MCLCIHCAQTVHAMDMEIVPLDKAKISVVKVASVLGDNHVVPGAIYGCLKRAI